MNRIFVGVLIIVVVLVGGAGLRRWERNRVIVAFLDGYTAGREDMRKIAVAALDKAAVDYDAERAQSAVDYDAQRAQSAAVRSTIIAEMAADERQQRQFEHERILERIPKTIVIGRKCGRFESPYLDNCTQ